MTQAAVTLAAVTTGCGDASCSARSQTCQWLLSPSRSGSRRGTVLLQDGLVSVSVTTLQAHCELHGSGSTQGTFSPNVG